MSRDKQIEEMAKDLENHTCMSEYQAKIASKMLYIKGYRKSADVAEEIFAEIKRIGGCLDGIRLNQWDIADLEKKYIGKDTNVTTKESEKDNG